MPSIHTLTYILGTASFVLTTLALAWANRIVHRKHPTWYFAALLSTLIIAMVLLGLQRGWLASLIVWLLSAGWFITYLDGRRFGKQTARYLGIKPNVMFSALDIGMPKTNLAFLQRLGRDGRSPDYAALRLTPSLLVGLTVLRARFGEQADLVNALAILPPYLERSGKEGAWDDAASADLGEKEQEANL
jgi:hypothetical protein